jgi:2-polyprenyl-3-methyl-5-hydroxy-6-metoxy-1,4-benzoquinol methylase
VGDFRRAVVRQHYSGRNVAERYERKYASGLGRRIAHWREQRVLRSLLREVPRGGSAIDIATGAGRMLPLLMERFPEVTAADLSEAMLEVAARRLAGSPSAVRLIQADASELPVRDESFDGVTCIRLLHHVHDPAERAAILAELARITRDWAIVSFFSRATVRARWVALTDRLRGRRPRSRVTLRPKDLQREAAQAGLRWVRSCAVSRLFSQHVLTLFKKTKPASPQEQ